MQLKPKVFADKMADKKGIDLKQKYVFPMNTLLVIIGWFKLRLLYFCIYIQTQSHTIHMIIRAFNCILKIISKQNGLLAESFI